MGFTIRTTETADDQARKAIVGPLIGAFIGSFAGALIGELTKGTSKTDSARVATGALIGRVVATAMKMGIGCAIAGWLFFAAMS